MRFELTILKEPSLSTVWYYPSGKSGPKYRGGIYEIAQDVDTAGNYIYYSLTSPGSAQLTVESSNTLRYD